jgi:hypothetical protein
VPPTRPNHGARKIGMNSPAEGAPDSTSAAAAPGGDLQATLDDARVRLHEIVVLSMKTWLPAETLK